VSVQDLLDFLSPALGEDKAREAIAATATTLGLRGNDFRRDDALSLLEAMARIEGNLGVVASFAKARFILRFPNS
jgi:hypothetical protein